MYQFYSEGFFGYGDLGDFHPFGLWHILPILLLVAAAVLTRRKREAIRGWKYERRFRYILSFVMLMAEMSYFWRLLYVGDEYGDFTLLVKLPIQVCQWGLICAVYMITSKSDFLFGINFFISLGCTTIALFVPQTVISQTGPGYFRYYQFWLEHLLPIYSTLYMMMVHGKRPKYRDLWTSMGFLVLLAIPSYMANVAIPEADYLYMRMNIPFMPDSILLRLPIYGAIILLLFHGMWLLWKYIEQKISAKGSR